MRTTPVERLTLLNSVTTTATGTAVNLADAYETERTFLANVSGTGSVSATVLVEVSNNNRHWGTLATFTLSGTTSATDVVVADESWQYVRGRVSAISGTGASVTLDMAY